jgi:hypothetical protein
MEVKNMGINITGEYARTHTHTGTHTHTADIFVSGNLRLEIQPHD